MAKKVSLVAAQQKWQGTDVEVVRGQTVTVQQAQDGKLWKVSPNTKPCDCGGNGIEAKNGYVMPGKPEGSLIARVGGGKPTFIGRGPTSFLADICGPLELVTNDDIQRLHGVGFEDNEGEVSVEIELSPALPIQVWANRKWQNSGFTVQLGQTISFSTKPGGPTWRMSPNTPHCPPDGNGLVAQAGYVLPGMAEGGLLCRIGAGAVEWVGRKNIIVANASGPLEFIANDDIGNLHGPGFDDNEGFVEVYVGC